MDKLFPNSTRQRRDSVNAASNSNPIFFALLCLLNFNLLCVGCSGSDPEFEVAPVRGIVTIDGKPFAGGKVMFAPIAGAGSSEAGKPGLGSIGSDGAFMLKTYRDGDGAVVGEHWVTVFPPRENAIDSGSKPYSFRRLRLPEKQVVNSRQDNQLEIHLTSGDVAQYGRVE